jgi:hypothetical protein
MNDDLARLRDNLNKLPFRVLVPFIVAISVASVLLYVALSPFAFLYRLLLRPMVWIEWEKQGIDTLLIDVESSHSREWLPRLQPLISRRAAHLNWTDRRNWDPASLPSTLFREFGPRGKTESLTGNYLPAVIVFHPLHRPKLFTFGACSKDLEEKLERLRAELSN